ncbi:MAG TPA: hypothetical protein VEC11_12175 [Allosphingosinicella sp.]|nr:hypothetical protein [Allosphingosinicella sp.]
MRSRYLTFGLLTLLSASAAPAVQPATAPLAPEIRCERPLTTAQPRSDAGLAAAPADPVAYFRQRARILALRGENRLAEAVPVAEAMVRQYACDVWVWTQFGDALMAANRPADAANAYVRAMEIGGPGTPAGVGYRLAVSHAAAGNRRAAMDVLEELVFRQAYRDRSNLYSNPAFASLRTEPRFLAISGRIDTSSLSRNDGWRRDLDYLLEEIRRVHPFYRRLPLPAEFTRLEQALRRDIPRLSDEQIYVGFARLVASLRHGHTGMIPAIQSARFPFTQLPLDLWAFPDGVYIVRAGAGASDLVGGRLVAIETTPALEVLRRVGEIHTRESGMEVLWSGPSLLRMAQILKGLGVTSRTDRIAVTVRLRSGQTVRRELATVPMEPRPKLTPPPGVAPPLFLRNVPEFHWSERISDNTLFVQLNQVQPDRDQSLAEFGLELRRILREQPIRNVILDLRHDNGGNTFLYTELLRTLVQFTADERNRLYVLIGRWTYSAAANLTTDLQRLARPIFVGEPTSATGNQFGDNALFALPYSSLSVGIVAVTWQLSDPWDRRPVVTPHIPVQLTAEAYFAGRDPALETIRALIASGSVPAGDMDPR